MKKSPCREFWMQPPSWGSRSYTIGDDWRRNLAGRLLCICPRRQPTVFTQRSKCSTLGGRQGRVEVISVAKSLSTASLVTPLRAFWEQLDLGSWTSQLESWFSHQRSCRLTERAKAVEPSREVIKGCRHRLWSTIRGRWGGPTTR